MSDMWERMTTADLSESIFNLTVDLQPPMSDDARANTEIYWRMLREAKAEMEKRREEQ